MRFLFILLFLFLTSCSSPVKSLLQPNGEKMDYQLLPIEFGLSKSVERYEYLELATYQSYIATIFKRELEQNICMQDKDRKTSFKELEKVRRA